MINLAVFTNSFVPVYLQKELVGMATLLALPQGENKFIPLLAIPEELIHDSDEVYSIKLGFRDPKQNGARELEVISFYGKSARNNYYQDLGLIVFGIGRSINSKIEAGFIGDNEYLGPSLFIKEKQRGDIDYGTAFFIGDIAYDDERFEARLLPMADYIVSINLDRSLPNQCLVNAKYGKGRPVFAYKNGLLANGGIGWFFALLGFTGGPCNLKEYSSLIDPKKVLEGFRTRNGVKEISEGEEEKQKDEGEEA